MPTTSSRPRSPALAQRRGYFDGRFAASRIDVYPGELAADITIDFVSGERYRFGPVTLDQSVVDPELALRYVDFKPGEPYDADRINELYTDLLAGGYFQNVELRTTPRPAPDLDVPLTIVLTASAAPDLERPVWATRPTPVRSCGSDYLNQRLNRQGASAGIQQLASPRSLGEATLSYRLPAGSPRDEWLSFDTGYKYDNPEDSTQRRVPAGREGRQAPPGQLAGDPLRGLRPGDLPGGRRARARATWCCPASAGPTSRALLPSRPRRAQPPDLHRQRHGRGPWAPTPPSCSWRRRAR